MELKPDSDISRPNSLRFPADHASMPARTHQLDISSSDTDWATRDSSYHWFIRKIKSFLRSQIWLLLPSSIKIPGKYSTARTDGLADHTCRNPGAFSEEMPGTLGKISLQQILWKPQFPLLPKSASVDCQVQVHFKPTECGCKLNCMDGVVRRYPVATLCWTRSAEHHSNGNFSPIQFNETSRIEQSLENTDLVDFRPYKRMTCYICHSWINNEKILVPYMLSILLL